jgi:hypothetical protein
MARGARLGVLSIASGCAALDRWEPIPPADPPPTQARPFDAQAAAEAMAATAAEVGEDCQGEQPGRGAVTIVFEPSGVPRSAELVPGGLDAGSPTGICVVEHFRAVRVPPFDGREFTITKNFAISEGGP